MTKEEVMAKINMLRYEYNDRYIDYCGVNEAVNMAIEALNAEPVCHGKWIDPASSECYRCSVCEEYVQQPMPKVLYHYCPWCGAKMDGVSNDRV